MSADTRARTVHFGHIFFMAASPISTLSSPTPTPKMNKKRKTNSMVDFLKQESAKEKHHEERLRSKQRGS